MTTIPTTTIRKTARLLYWLHRLGEYPCPTKQDADLFAARRAAFVAQVADPRTPEERLRDEWDADWHDTYRSLLP